MIWRYHVINYNIKTINKNIQWNNIAIQFNNELKKKSEDQ